MIYRFGTCELDVTRHVLLQGGQERPVEPQVFDLIHLLLTRPGELVSRDELIDSVWGGRIVSDATIDARINAARKALGDDGRAQSIIRTVPRRGIRLVCPVTAMTRPPAATRPERPTREYGTPVPATAPPSLSPRPARACRSCAPAIG
jgi:DNA-binding winged helix-turn-helix (wHTH) protein